MELYITFIISALLISCIYNKQLSTVLSLILLFAMMVATGLRASCVGADTAHYIIKYSHPTSDSLEFIFKFIIDLLQKFDFSPTQIQFSFSVITFIPLYYLIVKYSTNKGLTILIFIIAPNIYFLETMNIVRQSCALPYIIWSIFMFNEHKYLKGILLFIIAIGFHLSSLGLIPLLIFSFYWKPDFKFAIILVIISICLGLLTSTSIIAHYISYLQQLNFGGFEKYSIYSSWRLDSQRNIFGILPRMIFSFVIIYYAYKQYSNRLIVRTLLFAIIVNNIVQCFPNGFRFVFCLLGLEMFVIPLIIKDKRRLNPVIVSIIILMALNFIKVVPAIHSTHNASYVPYKSTSLF